MTNPGNKSALPIVETMRGPVPTLNENGKASIDFGLNYHQRKQAADTIEALVEAVEASNALVREVAAAIGRHGWNIYSDALVERAKENDTALARARGESHD